MKIKIDKSKCYGCGSCMALVPEVFEIDTDDGLAKLKPEFVGIDVDDPDLLKRIKLAVDSCPNGAISLELS